MSEDPSEKNLWRDIYLLLRLVDADILSLYAERGLPDFRPRYALPVIRLHHRGPMTIRALAEALGKTHSAMSQTVRELVRLDLVALTAGTTDARTRLVSLTDRGRSEVSFMEAEWRATEATLVELEAETPHPLSEVARDLRAALERTSFRDRVSVKLETRQSGG